MKIIFLDFDGVLNSMQEVVLHHRQQRARYRLFGPIMKTLSPTRKHVPIFGYGWHDAIRHANLRLLSDHYDFCPIACSNVQYILDKDPDVRIVVSSTWRLSGLEYVRYILKRNGIDDAKVIDITPGWPEDKSKQRGRGDQIQYWLDLNPSIITHFCIVDDDADMCDLMDRLVQTDPNEGFMWRHVQAVMKKLEIEH